MPRPAEILRALDVIEGVSAETLESFNAPEALVEMAKATNSRRGRHAAELRPSEWVTDVYADPHGSRIEDHNVGEPTEASGRGASEMTRRSSSPVRNPQADPASALGEALERMEEMARSLAALLRKATQQATYPSNAAGKNGQGGETEEEEEDEEEREKAKAIPDFRVARDNGLSTVEMDLRQFFAAIAGGGAPVAKANAVGKAKDALAKAFENGLLPIGYEGAVHGLMLHCEAAAKGIYPLWKLSNEVAFVPAEVARIMAEAIRQ